MFLEDRHEGSVQVKNCNIFLAIAVEVLHSFFEENVVELGELVVRVKAFGVGDVGGRYRQAAYGGH